MITNIWKACKTNQSIQISENIELFINDSIGVIQKRNKIIPNTIESKISTNNFKFIKLIGIGGISNIYQVLHIFSNKIFAMKIMNKSMLIQSKQFHYVIKEYNILKQITNFPFIITLHYAFQTPNYLCMVLDYCKGGNLMNITSISNPKLFMAELVLAIEFLHVKDIVYRDLKPENILLTEDGHIKLYDFNLSKEEMNEGIRAMSFCGSPYYLSPEMLLGFGVDKACDIYGMGLIFYEILIGEKAFNDRNPNYLYKKIMNNEIDLNNPKFSIEEKDLLSKMLTKDPDDRYNIFEVKKHKYFKGIEWSKVFHKEYEGLKITKEKTNKKQENNHVILNVEAIQNDYKKEMKYRVKNFFFINKDQEKETEDFSVEIKI